MNDAMLREKCQYGKRSLTREVRVKSKKIIKETTKHRRRIYIQSIGTEEGRKLSFVVKFVRFQITIRCGKSIDMNFQRFHKRNIYILDVGCWFFVGELVKDNKEHEYTSSNKTTQTNVIKWSF
jgi:hypothetical protein